MEYKKLEPIFSMEHIRYIRSSVLQQLQRLYTFTTNLSGMDE